MMVIPLTKNSSCGLDGLVFDPKFGRFKGDLKFGFRDFSVQFSNHF